MENLEVMEDMIQCIMTKGKVIGAQEEEIHDKISKTNCPLKNANQLSILEV